MSGVSVVGWARTGWAELDRALDGGPLAAGWQDQRWTLARVRDLIGRRFGVWYT